MGHESQAGDSNPALRALLDETRMSNTGLAQAVVAAGAEEGVHVGTNTTSVKRMLDGCQPRWPVPRLVAKVLSRHRHREISVTECGFADHSPSSDDRHDGLQCSGTLDDTVRTVVELSGRDMDRRKFLLGSAFSAAAFSEPALFALTVPPVESTARARGWRVGMADVEIITEHYAHLCRLDQRYGSGRVREQVLQLLHREANTVMHGTYSEKTGKALLGAVAQLTDLAAGTATDVGRHSLAQRYHIQALDLAMSAGDRLYTAHTLMRMSFLTVTIGQGAQTEHDRLRQARQALALARAGNTVAGGAATPMLSASLRAVEARGLALLGDAPATRQAILEAERQHQRIRPEAEPACFNGYAEAQLAADLGRCLRDTGESTQGIRQLTQALETNAPGRVRSHCIMQADLAAAHLAARDFEQAAAIGREAIRAATQVSSTRSLDRLAILQREIRPLRASSSHLTDLDDRITTLMTHNNARRDENTIA
ncbi:MAG: hypothetical protein ACRDQ5_19355 [Sciscionella sp.]